MISTVYELRVGLAAALHELAQSRQVGIAVDEEAIPVHAAVQASCELLGLDPLSLADEGRFTCILPELQAHGALRIMQNHSDGQGAAWIGRVEDEAHTSELLYDR